MDLIGELNRIKNTNAAETFDQATDSLESIRDFIAAVMGDAVGGFYTGTVTAVPGANQFTIAGLVGYGETSFVGWDAYVFWDVGGAGAAPQHETRQVTAYTNLGVFTTAAYTAAVGVGDIIILINPNFADVINDLAVPVADVATNLLERDVIGNKVDTVVSGSLQGLNRVPALDAATNANLRDVLGNKTDTARDTVGVSSVINLLRFMLSSGIGFQAIFNLVNAILTLAETGGTITATGPGTEDDVYRVETPMGSFKPITVKIDTTNMAAAESITVRVCERIIPGGGLILTDLVTFAGVQALPLKNIKLDANRFGVRVSLEQLSGVIRNYNWSAAWDG